MTQPLDVKRKALIALSVTMLIGTLGAGAYNLLSTPSNVPQSALTPPDPLPYQLPDNTENALPAAQSMVQDFTPPTQPIDLTIPASAEQILKLSEQIQLNELRTVADKAALTAKEASAALNGTLNPPNQLDSLFEIDGAKEKKHNIIDSVAIKSLVSTQLGISGYITIGNELMPIEKGTQIGELHVIALTAQYVDFSHQGKTTRKYLGR